MNNLLGGIGLPKEESKEKEKDKKKEKDKDKDGNKEDSSSSSSSNEEDKRIHAIKEAILKEEQDRFKRLSKKFNKNNDVDMTKGLCCCKYENAKGSKVIQILDILFFPNIPRWVFAVWSKVDSDRWPIYARMRGCTFYLFWALCLLGLIGDAMQ